MERIYTADDGDKSYSVYPDMYHGWVAVNILQGGTFGHFTQYQMWSSDFADLVDALNLPPFQYPVGCPTREQAEDYAFARAEHAYDNRY